MGFLILLRELQQESSNGRVIFPVREPFGSYLKDQFSNPTLGEKYTYQALYDSTLNSCSAIS